MRNAVERFERRLQDLCERWKDVNFAVLRENVLEVAYVSREAVRRPHAHARRVYAAAYNVKAIDACGQSAP